MVRVLAFAASTRRGSLNRKLIEYVARLARDRGADVDLADFRAFDMPLYDGDRDAAEGAPPGARELAARVTAASAMFIAVPEYNYSIPGTLKNAIDWVSRIRPMPWRGKSIYLLSASPSALGGARGLWQTRIPFEGCGALVFPDMFALAHANNAFAEDGALLDDTLRARLVREVEGFLRLAEAVGPILDANCDAPRRREAIVAALEQESSELQPPVAAKS